MKLGLAMLDTVSAINSLKYINQISTIQGETLDIYFQLIDVDSKTQLNQWGNRYIPAVGATLQIVINSINDANTLTKFATQVFPADDRSLWKVSLLATETANMAGINIQGTLTEGASIKKFNASNVLSVSNVNVYQC